MIMGVKLKGGSFGKKKKRKKKSKIKPETKFEKKNGVITADSWSKRHITYKIKSRPWN
jgi:hypothetical protein